MIRGLSAVCLLFALWAHSALAQDASSLLEAVRTGTASGNLLLRGEGVDAEAVDASAGALTLRAQLGFRTAGYRGWSSYTEFEAVAAPLGDDTYANGGAGALSNGVSDRPAIVDPRGAEVNQAWIQYARGEHRLTLGRQEIVLSDSRFVGNVGWRQNHQSFDAVRLDLKPASRLEATYAFVREAHRITGQDVPMRSHLAEGRLDLQKAGRFTAYAFLLDYTRSASLSRSTVGARYEGKRSLGEKLDAMFDVGYARQSDAFDNPADVEADYLAVGLQLKRNRTTVSMRMESLSGSASKGSFATPLATLHKFNGWADMFLSTPSDGLVDVQAGVSHVWGKTTISAIGHDFAAQTGNAHHGSEFDLMVTRPLSSGLMVGGKFAHYLADDTGKDVSRVWLWASFGF